MKIVLLLVSNTKVRDFPVFQGISWLMKNTKGQTYSEPDVGMRFTAKISNVWAHTRLKVAGSASESRYSLEILNLASISIILSGQRKQRR